MQYHFQDIAVCWDRQQLTLRNRRLRRVIDWSRGLPRTVRLALDGRKIPLADDGVCDCAVAGFPVPGMDAVRCDYQVADPVAEPLPAEDGDGVRITLRTRETGRGLEVAVSYILYPELPVLAMELAVESAVLPLLYWTPRSGEEFSKALKQSAPATVVDSLAPVGFAVEKSVEFRMRTDVNDTPVLEHPYCGENGMVGNILIARDDGGRKLFYLQEAPPSQERRTPEPYDFTVSGGRIAALESAFNPGDITPGRRLVGHRLVLGAAGDGDVAHLLRRYLVRRRPASRAIAGAITVNPWGCGHFPELVSEDFLHEEIRAAARLGADFYQIDDGYENGALSDMVVHNQVLDKHFWKINPARLPKGFASLAETAHAAQIGLALWFAPSANREYRDWRDSADILLEFHRKYGIDCFKLDGVQLQSYTAEENFASLLRTLFRESAGRITVNLDVTNGTRGGLFRFAEYGTVFLENRYVCHRWPNHPYHPEHTLRNLWHLAHWCNIQSLQIEIPSPDDCRTEFYRARGLAVPLDYPVEYWCLIAAMASPLLWFAPSRLRAESAARIGAVTTLLRGCRDRWRDAEILPVGQEPDGSRITGFYAASGDLLVFRELRAPAAAHLELPQFRRSELVYGTAPGASLAPDGTVTLPEGASAALFHLE